MKAAVADHFKMLVNFMGFMTVLVLLVGGISLITIMSINVVERTHELGILKAIGAANGQIFGIIISEGITIGILSWIIAILLSVPFSFLFSNNLAVLFIQTTADYIFNPLGVFLWLAMAIMFSALASMVPAWRVLKLSARDTLAYE
jgi:putative ABC transport system permease protein